MTMWSRHSLAGDESEHLILKRGARVRSVKALPRVPEGTEGKVILVGGFNWRRYRVLFENGIEIGSLDAKSIEKVEPKPKEY